MDTAQVPARCSVVVVPSPASSTEAAGSTPLVVSLGSGDLRLLWVQPDSRGELTWPCQSFALRS